MFIKLIGSFRFQRVEFIGHPVTSLCKCMRQQAKRSYRLNKCLWTLRLVMSYCLSEDSVYSTVGAIFAPVSVTKSIRLFCVYLRKLQKGTLWHCIWNTWFHPEISCFSSGGNRTQISLHQSFSLTLESWLCCGERCPRFYPSACFFYFLGKLQFVLVTENTLLWLLWICAQRQMKTMMNREHFPFPAK